MESKAEKSRRGKKTTLAVNWSFAILRKLFCTGVFGVASAVPSHSCWCRQPGWGRKRRSHGIALQKDCCLQWKKIKKEVMLMASGRACQPESLLRMGLSQSGGAVECWAESCRLQKQPAGLPVSAQILQQHRGECLFAVNSTGAKAAGSTCV